MITQAFDLEKYLTQLRLSSKLKIEAINQEINIGPDAIYEVLLSTKPNMYSLERYATLYSDIPRNIEVQYFIDDSVYGHVLPSFRLLEPKREIPFLYKWVKGTFVKFIISNLHRYGAGNLVLQAFPEYIEISKVEELIENLRFEADYNVDKPTGRYEPAIMNFVPTHRCKTCLSGARITFDTDDNISRLSFQDRISYQPNNVTYFWGSGGHDCPLLHYTNKSQILIAIAEGKIEAI